MENNILEQKETTPTTHKENLGLYLFSLFFAISLIGILAFAIVKPS